MFRQEKRLEEFMLEKAEIVYQFEGMINLDDKVYLMTWSPDPKQIPDCDFINQHKWCVPYVHDYLIGCRVGLACVESTQLGNPHYHLWYQTSDDPKLESLRIRWIKVLSRIGNVKITSARYVKINDYRKTNNALYYYKVDMLDQQLSTPYNPIYPKMELPQIDYNDYTWFFSTGKITAKRAHERASAVRELEEFYKKSF